MHCWEKLKRLLGFEKHYGADASARRHPAEQFKKLAKAGIMVEDRIDDGIPLKSAYADQTALTGKPFEVYFGKTVCGSGTVVYDVEDADIVSVAPKSR